MADEQLATLFNAAANAVQAFATGQIVADKKPTEQQLLELYGLYKVATTGPCREPQPGLFNLKGKAKWAAWKDKSDLSEETAMANYIKQVMALYNWIPDLSTSDGNSLKTPGGGGFAPAVSRPHVPVEDNFEDVDTPFGWVKDDKKDKIKGWIKEGKANVNLADSDGLTLLHWAVDRGRKEICEILLNAGANPELKDEDEQTPLDYALTCEHEDIIKLLKSRIPKSDEDAGA